MSTPPKGPRISPAAGRMPSTSRWRCGRSRGPTRTADGDEDLSRSVWQVLLVRCRLQRAERDGPTLPCKSPRLYAQPSAGRSGGGRPRGARRGDEMTAFTVWKFDDPDGAQRAVKTLKYAEQDHLVKIMDHAVVSWPVGASKPDTKQAHEDSWRGTGWGAFWGVLFGALFFIPVIGGLAGAAIGHISKA